MIDKSICAKCVELIRVKVKRVRRDESFTEEVMVCSMEVINESLGLNDVIQKCSRFVKVPEES